jgi:hypothetical protein
LRQRSGFQSNPLEAVALAPQNLQQGFRLARYLHLPRDPARVIIHTTQMLVSLTDT